MSLYQTPPDSILINGEKYHIDTDFRVWMEFQGIFASGKSDTEKAGQLYNLMERLGLPPSKPALDSMLEFYSGESHENADGSKNRPIAFDFEQDSEFIYSAFLGAYGIDLAASKIHWWKFKALFKSLPSDCEFCRIMGYRITPITGVPKNQRQFYRNMKTRYALKKQLGSGYRTEQDMRDYVKRRYEEAQARMPTLRGSGQSGDVRAKCESG